MVPFLLVYFERSNEIDPSTSKIASSAHPWKLTRHLCLYPELLDKEEDDDVLVDETAQRGWDTITPVFGTE